MSFPPGGPAGQVCCVCLYTREGTAEDAVTTIRGYSVCEDHLGLVAQGSEWNSIIVIGGRRVREGLPFTPTASPAPDLPEG